MCKRMAEKNIKNLTKGNFLSILYIYDVVQRLSLAFAKSKLYGASVRLCLLTRRNLRLQPLFRETAPNCGTSGRLRHVKRATIFLPLHKTLSSSFFIWCCLYGWLWLTPALPAAAQSTYTLETGVEADSARQASKKVLPIAIGAAAVYTGGLLWLNETWYKNEPRSSFHWFNDAREWKQMDKLGHFWGAFHESRLGVDVLRSLGVSEKKAIWWGGSLGFLLQTPIEYFDGRSPAYGASASDIATNAAGSLAVISQQLAWGELRLTPKFSFHRSRYAELRPNVLGNGLAEELLKDYNGQTYWLSVDVAKFLPASSQYPKWLNVALGYGAEEMVYHDTDANQALGLQAYRQYYLSLDLNWQAIPTRSKFLRGAFYVLNAVKLPAPAVEWNGRRGWRLHGLYF